MSTEPAITELKSIIARHWGYQTFRPLQEPAMRAVLAGRDSLVVMPTGGGKSLCYQAPAVLRGETTVVVSPLIALMKDQVDGLKASGVSAIQIDSSQTPSERSATEFDIAQGKKRLLFVAPERLAMAGFQRLLQQLQVKTFAIDEAHCISHWGHDFRPEYRQLKRLKGLYPGAAVHAYTATATQAVRNDIIQQLGLSNPEVLVGNFDRPNLTYRIVPRTDLTSQVEDVLERHSGEAGIIYCLRRTDVDSLAAHLQGRGRKALPYHAGMDPEQRSTTQEAFKAERCDLIVATVAFGMGIDRSNIRFVLHAAMPKSIEHYQQETGRAGRDGLEAECVLLHSGSDFMSWKYIVEKSASQPGVDPAFLANSLKHLNDIDRYCRGVVCRHQALVRYFGQENEGGSCQACDICLGDAESVPDAPIIAQKILSCVARVKEGFGVRHVASVLLGEATDNIRKHSHETLSTFGLLREHTEVEVREWIKQLVSQELLVQTSDEYPVLHLNNNSWDVMKGKRSVRLLQSGRKRKSRKLEQSTADVASWEGVDRELFEALRDLRRQLAQEKKVAPYLIFSDATLREMARIRPSNLEVLHSVFGVGEAKLDEFGSRFLAVIVEQCRQRSLTMDQAPSETKQRRTRRSSGELIEQRRQAFRMFEKEASIAEVMKATDRARSTVCEYLSEYIQEKCPASISPWVADDDYARIARAAKELDGKRLKPIFLHLGEKTPYDDIRLVVTHLASQDK